MKTSSLVAPGARSTAVLKATEIKVTIKADEELRALRAFKVDEDTAEVRVIHFFDTPQLSLFDSGIVLRSRLVKGDADDTTVKVRPVVPSKISPSWIRRKGFKMEADRAGRKSVTSASLTEVHKRAEIDAVAEGKEPISKIFSETQLGLIKETTGVQVDPDLLSPLGPIRVLCWQSAHKEFPYRLTIEEWRLPNGEDLVEVSIKVSPDEEKTAVKHFEGHLRELGLDPNGEQQTKTRTALTYFAKTLRSRKRK